MAENVEITEQSKESIYTFRFGISDKFIHLNQQQLNRIPYLSTLVTHKEDFLAIRNENGEYVLNPPIHYKWFIAILHSITSEQPYILFTELPEDENILDTLQLFDYLGINSFAFPLLEEKHVKILTPIHNADEERKIEYHRASLSEARNTAAEFVIALTKNEYDFHDSDTVTRIYKLILNIFWNLGVFSARFRHHTLVIVKEYCWTYFSKSQQRQLPNRKEIAQDSKMDLWNYISSDNQLLSKYFYNVFAWNGIYKITKKTTKTYSVCGLMYPAPILFITGDEDAKHSINPDLVSSLHLSKNKFDSYYLLNVTPTKVSHPITDYDDNKFYTNEARSRRLNNLPKRSDVDKFKHRSCPKTQKYR